jgi:Zn-dependent peptidase ImmA (M78 family)/transcriptional regulator with XRE-family HTH domain
MTQPINPSMIVLAREYRGLTQRDLASNLGITPAVVSRMEADLYPVSEEMLQRVAGALKFPRRFFFEPTNIYPLGVHFYRKAKSIPQKVLSPINAEINIDSIRIDKLLQAAGIRYENVPLIDLDAEPEKYGSPADVARALRIAWRVPSGPIGNMTKLLEDNGIMVIYSKFESRMFDSVSFRTRGGQYVVFVNSAMCGDRIRYSLAHECGHIVIHRIPHDRIEDEANEFAAELLLPEREIRPFFSKVTLQTLADLKRYWKVSMQALLVRSFDVGRINKNQYRYLWMQMAKLHYKTSEPIEIPREEGTLLQEIVSVYVKEYNYNQSELKELLYLEDDDDFVKFNISTPSTLRVVPRVQTMKSTKNQEW